MAESFDVQLAEVVAPVEDRLRQMLFLPAGSDPGEVRLMAAMRHAVLAGGKRLRPFLVIETARLFGATMGAGVIEAAAAIECLHCYSLVHDDLPAMDDDDIRRGQPTTHIAFDEATAILAGDGLLTLAFERLADPLTHGDASVRVALVLELAKAAGYAGMVGGQMLDLAAEGRFGDGRPQALSDSQIRRLQAMKTGALIASACRMGALLAGVDTGGMALMSRYGEILGLAFQLADDLLDVTGDAAVVGKATAKDADRGKGTLVQLNGIAATRAELSSLVQEAAELLGPHGQAAQRLAAAAHFIAYRSK